MPIPNIPVEALQDAMKRFDRDLRSTPDWANWEQNRAYRYAIEHHDHRFSGYRNSQARHCTSQAPAVTPRTRRGTSRPASGAARGVRRWDRPGQTQSGWRDQGRLIELVFVHTDGMSDDGCPTSGSRDRRGSARGGERTPAPKARLSGARHKI
jgi:hypothetical protein